MKKFTLRSFVVDATGKPLYPASDCPELTDVRVTTCDYIEYLEDISYKAWAYVKYIKTGTSDLKEHSLLQELEDALDYCSKVKEKQ